MLTSRTTGGVILLELSTGGSGYTAPPTVALAGGGGAGATVAAHMAGTMVSSLVIANAGTGYTSAPTVSFSGGGGTGAAATAYVYAGALRPMHFFQGRKGEVYGVDGMGRGVRIDCGATQAIPIGVEKPGSAPTASATTGSAGKFVSAIHLVRQGAGYTSRPPVVITGGTPSKAAKATAVMVDGRVQSIDITERGAGYAAAPTVSLSGGFPTAATFAVSVSGGVEGFNISNAGTGYVSNATTSPAVVFSTAQGLTNALAVPFVDELGRITSIQVLAAGTGATTTGVTASITGGAGSGAVVTVNMRYSVTGATATNGGAGHQTPPILSFTPSSSDPNGFGAAAVAAVSGGSITGVTVLAGGDYAAPPTLGITDTTAQAVAVLSPVLRGKYLCCVRYVDETRDTVSSISDIAEVDAGDGADGINWAVTHPNIDDRVTAMELWRTSADQAVVLYRVATIKKNATGWTSYPDTIPDHDLVDADRAGFGLMPITLPSGQLNARRFGVLPHNYAVGVMFQDRAWFAVDTTGRSPNSLLFSEVEEPESVPAENEIVLQENAGEYDSIVSLLPFGAELLIAQTGHLYSLRYVAQPVIDASITLVAYRGALNPACCAVMNGVAFFADSYGVYAFDGSQEKSLSAAVDNYWRDNIIDFSKSAKFHLSTDFNSKVLRFHYCKTGDTQPVRALCYCLATEAWWEETYPSAVTSSATLLAGGQRTPVFGTAGGAFVTPVAGPDPQGAVEWQYRSGNMRLKDEPSRSVSFTYTPTSSACDLRLSLHYNGSSSARANAVASNPGTGFVATAGSTQAVLGMASTRSPLGDATGHAMAMAAGRLDPRSAGADRHLAIGLAGTQGSSPVQLHSVSVDGVA